MTGKINKRYITTRSLQDKLDGMGRTTIYRAFEKPDGWLPKPIKLGGRLFWDEAEVDAAIAAHAG